MTYEKQFEKETGHKYCVINRPHRPTEKFVKWLKAKLTTKDKALHLALDTLGKYMSEIEIKIFTCYWGNENGDDCIFVDELRPIIKKYNKIKEQSK
jgi:hypothetical protein